MKAKSKFLSLLEQMTEDANPNAVGSAVQAGVSGINTAKTNYDQALYTAFSAHPDGPAAMKDPAKLADLMKKISQFSNTSGVSGTSAPSVPSGVTPAV